MLKLEKLIVNILNRFFKFRIGQFFKQIHQEFFKISGILFWINLLIVLTNILIHFNHRNSFINDLHNFIFKHFIHISYHCIIASFQRWHTSIWIIHICSSNILSLTKCILHFRNEFLNAFFSNLPFLIVHLAWCLFTVIRNQELGIGSIGLG